MRILAIESSCDETSVAIVDNGKKIISNVIASQEKIHRKYHGVVPELASREHIRVINPLIKKACDMAKIKISDLSKKIDGIAYTRGPGLAGSLLVGQVTAQTLSFLFKLPLVDVNHVEGHIYAVQLQNPNIKPPFLSLVVSGGHTELIIVKNYGEYKLLGGTRDDAAGEAFDKVAKLLKLPYPGGPEIDQMSKKGDSSKIAFPRPLLWGTWDFSFSGLKTAVVNYVHSRPEKCFSKQMTADICASFQKAVVDTLIAKTFKAADEFKIKKIVVGGGVSANSELQQEFAKEAKNRKKLVFLPKTFLCTDNAAMIAVVGYHKFCYKKNWKKSAFSKIEPDMQIVDWKR